jgi:hypothetical protein
LHLSLLAQGGFAEQECRCRGTGRRRGGVILKRLAVIRKPEDKVRVRA